MNTNRRNFIKKSAIAAAAISSTPAILNACASPNEKITVALIGCRGMGFTDLQAFLKEDNVECIGLCDVDSQILEGRAAEVENLTQKRPVLYKDFREVLDNPDINTVIIGTPDHWHALMMIMALEAGKHVYVEKPMGHSIEECNTMVKAAAKYPKQVVQVGMWQRSSKHWFDASEVVKSGELGDVKLVKAWIYKGYDEPYAVKPDTEAPEYVDYDMWLGPAPKRPFNENRFHYNFRWYWDYAGGAMTDWGVHLLDFALYAMDAGYPDSISPGGGIYLNQGAVETPDFQQALYNYQTHSMVWECGLNPGIGPYGKGHGVAFVGTRGTLILTRDDWQVLPETNNSTREPFMKGYKIEGESNNLQEHVKNFLKCIREGGKPNTPVEVGAKTAIVSEMGNIAYRTGKIIHWDHENKKFLEEEANKLIKLSYRDPWKIPVF
ncbi:MAG: Gfo/Idh/MocA family oxidoreductase [Prolixibacteraceae bacterium]|nr:Gfo/Idh/MocA family oxidoreductase [Prolixibacteraceae bacterium]MBN2773231.1 Gfo/Idh/MocA family oxidoreductase [Prolixibacteraceae bacterium]